MKYSKWSVHLVEGMGGSSVECYMVFSQVFTSQGLFTAWILGPLLRVHVCYSLACMNIPVYICGLVF